MWKKKIFDGTELGLSKPFTFLQLNSIALPRLTLDNKIITEKGQVRATLEATGRVGGGGHSSLVECIRHAETDQKLILLKKSKEEEINFRTEAFIQWLAQKIMASLGRRIPQVFDILELPEDTVGFTMLEFADATLCSRYLISSKSIHTDILHILSQAAILLQVLEDSLALDHRDLKADNLLILPEPSSITYTCSGKRYKLVSPFTVAIVDFGFACLGDEHSITEIDAGDGTLPPLDPCPKDGRDLFHLIISLYGVEGIRTRLSSDLHEAFAKWMDVRGKACGTLAERWSHSEWVYLLTSRKEFVHPTCTPRAILEKIRSMEPDLFISL